MRLENVETLEVSKAPIKTGRKQWVYRHISQYDKNEEFFYNKIPIVSFDKILKNNQDIQIKSLDYFNEETGELIFSSFMGEIFKSSIDSEKIFYESMGLSKEDFSTWLKQSGKEYFNEGDQYLTIDIQGDKILGSLSKHFMKNLHNELISEINSPTSAYTVKIHDRNEGGFFCKINNIDCYMPGSLAAPNKIHDFDSFLGKEVVVMIDGYQEEKNIFIVSHKKYISFIWNSAIKKLNRNTQYTGIITGFSKNGIFVEFENIFTGLIFEKEMNPELLDLFKNKQIKSGDSINIFILAIDKNKRIHLTSFSKKEKDLEEKENIIEDIIEENLENKVFLSEIKQIKPFGALVKIEPIDQWCLLSQKEISKNRLKINVGDKILLAVDKVNIENGKILMRVVK